MSQKVIILKGLPASGKTTWAKKFVQENGGLYKRISKDDLRAMAEAILRDHRSQCNCDNAHGVCQMFVGVFVRWMAKIVREQYDKQTLF